jgi:hypothetical protein
MIEPNASHLVPTELTPDQPSLSPGTVALQAEKLGNTDQLRQAISDELDREALAVVTPVKCSTNKPSCGVASISGSG